MKKGFKRIIAASLLGTFAVSVLGAGFAAADNLDDHAADLDSLQTALEADDYEAFIDALAQIDELAAKHISEEDFENIVDHYDGMVEVQDALEAEDYDAWVEAMQDMPQGEALVEMIDEEDFNSFIDMIEAKESGDMDTAMELSHELGLDEFKQQGKEFQEERMERKMAHIEEVQEALDNEDYEAWLEAISGSPREEILNEIINEDNFDQLVEMHELRESGDNLGAKEIAEELNLPKPGFQAKAKKAMNNMNGILKSLFR